MDGMGLEYAQLDHNWMINGWMMDLLLDHNFHPISWLGQPTQPQHTHPQKQNEIYKVTNKMKQGFNNKALLRETLNGFS